MRINTHSASPSATEHKSHWEGSLSYSCQQRDASTSRHFTRRSLFAGKTLKSRLWEFSPQSKAESSRVTSQAGSFQPWSLLAAQGQALLAPRELAASQPGTCGVSWDLCWQYCSWFQWVSSSMKKHSRKEVAASPGMITDLVVKNISCSLENRAPIKTLCN